MDLEIIAANRADIPGIRQVLEDVQRWLAAQGSRQWSKPFTDEWIRGYVDRGEFIVAKMDGRVVGVFRLIWIDDEYWGEREDGQAGYIHTLAVHRSCKGQSIGRQMLAWAEQHIREKGRPYARLDCSAHFRHYYQAEGYKQVGTQQMGDWEAQLMEKGL